MKPPGDRGLRMIEPPEHAPVEGGGEEADLSFVDRWVMPYIEDSALWPVTLVVIAHLVAFLAPALLFAVRERSAFAILGLIGVGYLTFAGLRYEIRRRGRPAAISAILLATWALGISLAWYGARIGIL